MFRNTYDSDNTVFSPQGRLHQVEYACEAVKQGSAVVGLRSDTHCVVLGLKRSTGELASYQKKLLRIDNHIGIAFAGLTSDARVLSNFMRQQALSSRMLYDRPLPINRIVNAIADRAQMNTMQYGKRPYGVGFLVAGHDETGPHLYEFNPTGNCFEFYAMAMGSRSQSSRTYLEKHYEEFKDVDLDTLVMHGLRALRDSLQQDKELDTLNTSVGIVGVDKRFKIVEGNELKQWLDQLPPRELPGAGSGRRGAAASAGAGAGAAAEPSTTGGGEQGGDDTDVEMQG